MDRADDNVVIRKRNFLCNFLTANCIGVIKFLNTIAPETWGLSIRQTRWYTYGIIEINLKGNGTSWLFTWRL